MDYAMRAVGIVCVLLICAMETGSTTTSTTNTTKGDNNTSENSSTTTETSTISTMTTTTTPKGLLCYTCGQDAVTCKENIEGLLESADKGSGMYFKDCTAAHPNYTMCMIESISSQGRLQSYMRDCSDGKKFSFPLVNQLAYLAPNNKTVCTYYDTGYTRCVSLCNSGDYCNGPIPSHGVWMKGDILVMFVSVHVFLWSFS